MKLTQCLIVKAQMIVLTLGKNLALTILLSVIIYGLGEIYLGLINRGVIVLIVGIGVSLAASLMLPFYIAAPIIFVYWVWQLVDAYQQYKKLNKSPV
jgi:TM2 domain-containing membrane protein YozV